MSKPPFSLDSSTDGMEMWWDVTVNVRVRSRITALEQQLFLCESTRSFRLSPPACGFKRVTPRALAFRMHFVRASVGDEQGWAGKWQVKWAPWLDLWVKAKTSSRFLPTVPDIKALQTCYLSDGWHSLCVCVCVLQFKQRKCHSGSLSIPHRLHR